MIDISRTELIRAINEWVTGRNAWRNRKIMIMRLCDGYTYEHIAEEFGLSERQIKNIVYKGEEEVFKHI